MTEPADPAAGPAPWHAPAGWGGPADSGSGNGDSPSSGGQDGGQWAGTAGFGTGFGQGYGQGYGYGYGGPPAAPQPGVVPLRPLGLGEVLDGAVSIIRRYPRPTLGLSAAIAVVSTLANVLLILTAFRPLADLQNLQLQTGPGSGTEAFDGQLGGAALGGGGALVVAAFATVVLTGVLTTVVGRAVLGQPMTLGEAWQQVRPRMWRLLGLSLLVNLLVAVVLAAGIGAAVGLIVAFGPVGGVVGVPLGVLAAVAAVFLYVRWSLAPAVLVLEHAGVRQSMRRSGVLVRRSWWRVLGILLLALVIASIVTQVIQIPFLVAGFAGTALSGAGRDSTLLLVGAQIGAGFAQALVRPFSTGVRSLLYVDRRMRAEGLDVSLQASAGVAQG